MKSLVPMELVQQTQVRTQSLTVPGYIFAIYGFFLIDYFGRLSARIPAYAAIRPTLLLLAVLTIALISQSAKIKHAFGEKPIKIICWMIGYIFLTLLLVKWPGSVLNNLDSFVKAAAFLFLTATIIDTDRRLKIFVILFIGLQMVRILEPLLTYMITGELQGQTYIGGGQWEGRLAGARADVINANGLGFVIVTTLTYMHFIMGGSPSRLIRWIYFALTLLFLYALILTGSRGAFITFIVLAIFIFLDSERKLLLIAFASLAVVFAVSNMSEFQKERYGSIFIQDSETASGRTAEGRLEGMKTEFRLGMNRPIFGHGLGTTSEAKVNVLGVREQAAHNLYAELLIEIGFIGAAFFMAYLFSLKRLLRANLQAFRQALSNKTHKIDNFKLRLNKALLAIFWVYAVYSINYFGLSQEYWYLFGGLCVAFARSIARSEENNELQLARTA